MKGCILNCFFDLKMLHSRYLLLRHLSSPAAPAWYQSILMHDVNPFKNEKQLAPLCFLFFVPICTGSGRQELCDASVAIDGISKKYIADV